MKRILLIFCIIQLVQHRHSRHAGIVFLDYLTDLLWISMDAATRPKVDLQAPCTSTLPELTDGTGFVIVA